MFSPGRQVYWTENADPVRIMRGGLDGGYPQVFLDSHLVHPDHLLIDHPTATLYWVDTVLGAIYSVPLGGPLVGRAASMQVRKLEVFWVIFSVQD